MDDLGLEFRPLGVAGSNSASLGDRPAGLFLGRGCAGSGEGAEFWPKRRPSENHSISQEEGTVSSIFTR